MTLSDPLQKRLVVTRPTSAKAAWKILTDIVKDNKRSRTSALKAELRSIKLGTLNMEAYFQKIESLVIILTSLDCIVNDENMVHYALEGLPDNEEMRLKSKELALPTDSSSPMVLMAKSGTNRRPSNPQVKSWRPYFNFAKGSCRFGSECRYVHDPNAKPHDLGNSKQSNTSNTDALLVKRLDKLRLNDARASQNCSTVTSSVVAPSVSVGFATHNNISPMYYMTQLVSPYIVPPGFTSPQGLFTQPTQASIPLAGFGLLPAQYTSQQQLAQQIGSSLLRLRDQPNKLRQAQQDFLTRRVLFRCDSTGDYYPVTDPSPIPHAFLVSQNTWHQQLGHPRCEVLRRLVSNNVISCNKEKPPVLCHAC
nr:ribonuclease H-like domain-containing protein [Tanacetum cinerariifolium]